MEGESAEVGRPVPVLALAALLALVVVAATAAAGGMGYAAVHAWESSYRPDGAPIDGLVAMVWAAGTVVVGGLAAALVRPVLILLRRRGPGSRALALGLAAAVPALLLGWAVAVAGTVAYLPGWVGPPLTVLAALPAVLALLPASRRWAAAGTPRVRPP